jgi:hypothetical protein
LKFLQYLRNLAGGLDWNLGKRWRIGLGYHAFWLATTLDGLYTSGDECLTNNRTATSNHVGNQVMAQATYEFSERFRLHAGYGRFVPGAYLKASSFTGSQSTPYVMWNYRF